jgi:hypothetical protein
MPPWQEPTVNQAELAAAFRRLEALQAAAAEAGPAVAALVALAVERGEAKPYKSIGLTQAVFYWIQQQPLEPPAPLQTAHNDPAHDAIIRWCLR